eukprot:873189-Amphidinium_carterae.1
MHCCCRNASITGPLGPPGGIDEAPNFPQQESPPLGLQQIFLSIHSEFCDTCQHTQLRLTDTRSGGQPMKLRSLLQPGPHLEYRVRCL